MEPFTCIDHEDVDDDDPQKLENELKHVTNLIDNLFSIWEEDMQDMEEIHSPKSFSRPCEN